MRLILKRLLLNGPRNTPIWARWSLTVAIICAPVFALLNPNDPIEVIGLVLCILMNMLVAWLIEALHSAIAREERASAKLSSAVNTLRQAEAEKVLLLEEYSHRIGNDYQRLLGIVMTQERLTRDGDNAREAVAVVRRRIEATVALHSRLTRMTSNGLSSSIDSRAFLAALVDDFSSTVALQPIIVLTKAESHMIPLKQAASLGLIVNEAITNALKYAFPDERSGRIQVTFARRPDGFLLAIEDNGVGLPVNASPQGTGFGSRIIRSLAANLEGAACMSGLETGGTVLEVRFPDHSGHCDLSGRPDREPGGQPG
jgi:two-component system, sensor histidine kinase PdtaS